MLHGVLYTLFRVYFIVCTDTFFFLYVFETLDSSFLIQFFLATSKMKLKAGLVRPH